MLIFIREFVRVLFALTCVQRTHIQNMRLRLVVLGCYVYFRRLVAVNFTVLYAYWLYVVRQIRCNWRGIRYLDRKVYIGGHYLYSNGVVVLVYTLHVGLKRLSVFARRRRSQ